MKSEKATLGRRARLLSADEVLARARQRPGYSKEYDALEGEFALVAALIRARIEAGLTQEQLAQRMNTTQAVVARLEAGGRRPSTRTLERFAVATGTRLIISFERKKKDRSAA